MELKDNFTNRYFKPDLIQKQLDMIKEPTATDAYADAFTQAGQQATNGPAGYEANALMSGIGAGLKAHANSKRQEDLSPILQMTGQVNAQAAYLEAQMQEQQQETMQTQEFLANQSYAFSELAKAATAGDTSAMNNIARGVLQAYKHTSGDAIIGDFDHYHDGNIYYTNSETGEKGGLNIAQLIYQSGVPPEQIFGPDYPMVMSAFSTGFKGQYENAQEMQRLAMEKEHAIIDQTKAHAGLYNAQVKNIENDIANPPLTPAQVKTKELNEVKFNKRTDEAEDKRVLNNAYEKYIENILEAKQKGLTGKSKLAEWKRYWSTITGQSENMDVEEMLRITHANRVKELGGSNANQRQFEVAMASAPSITKDPDATIEFLDNVINKNNEFISETDYLGDTWEKSQYQGQERAILNDYRNQQQKNKDKPNRGNLNNQTVTMQNAAGEIFQIPQNQVEAALNDNEEPLTLVE